MEATTNDVITLITCGGTWQRDAESRYGGDYSHRIIVRAERGVPGGSNQDE
jgi:sortase (surface protein transpeptidase)